MPASSARTALSGWSFGVLLLFICLSAGCGKSDPNGPTAAEQRQETERAKVVAQHRIQEIASRVGELDKEIAVLNARVAQNPEQNPTSMGQKDPRSSILKEKQSLLAEGNTLIGVINRSTAVSQREVDEIIGTYARGQSPPSHDSTKFFIFAIAAVVVLKWLFGKRATGTAGSIRAR